MKLTAITTWNDDPRTGCKSVCPEFGVEATGMDPEESRTRLKKAVLIWMLNQEGGYPLKVIVTEFEVTPPVV